MIKISIHRQLLLERKIEEDKNSLIRALKSNDAEGAYSALAGLAPQDLGMDANSFKQLADALKNRDLDTARQAFGVGKNVQQTTQTHNPVTGQPWSSGPVYGLSSDEVKTVARLADRPDFKSEEDFNLFTLYDLDKLTSQLESMALADAGRYKPLYLKVLSRAKGLYPDFFVKN